MKYSLQNIDDVAVVSLDTQTINDQKFKMKIKPLLENHKKLVFDMNRVRLIDSRCCGALLACLRELDAYGGDLKLCRVSKHIRAFFELIRIHHVLEMFDTIEEAVVSYQIAYATN